MIFEENKKRIYKKKGEKGNTRELMVQINHPPKA